MATFLVNFKNAGNADTVSFYFERENGIWKILDFHRKGVMLTGILLSTSAQLEKVQESKDEHSVGK